MAMIARIVYLLSTQAKGNGLKKKLGALHSRMKSFDGPQRCAETNLIARGVLKVSSQLSNGSKSRLEAQRGNTPMRKSGISQRGTLARDAILQAAERIFAEEGINASLR